MLLLILALTGCHRDKDEEAITDTWGDSAEPWETDWTAPDCATSGSAAVTWFDGESAAERAEALEANTFTWSVVTLASPGRLVASHEGSLLLSDDGGCTWSEIPLLADRQQVLTAADDLVYAWSTSDETIYRLEGEDLTTLTSPDESLVGLAADPADPLHLRAGNDGCDIYESTDGGESWTLSQPAPSKSIHATSVVFDPEDLDHVVCTMTGDGAFASFNGGERWDRARGFQTDESVNFFGALITPGSREVVWAHGLRVADTRNLLWRSDDGGLTWALGVEEGAEVVLGTNVALAVHPSAPNLIAFSNGENLYTYDARTETLTASTPAPDQDIRALSASPARLGLWYIGLSYQSLGP